ncbi:DUF262 domain-containing protein [Nodularia spumigena CS-584]|nr:DUF262 domain-containing protein [Nodularia spumigena CS-584]
MSIETLFNNPDRVDNTNYKPFYQRNYVWDDEKATYFIESILLGTEIPPLIYFRTGDHVEVIDGRQRYQTIKRFIENDFTLKKNGLQKLDNIGIENKGWKDLSSSMQDLFYDTKLRLIEFSFHSPSLVDEENEELVKKEIFKRYNSGITPLKPTEIDNAAYFEDDLNAFIKNKFKSDKILFRDVSKIFHFEKTDIETILKKVRQLLVQHKIPIKYYSVKKNTVISKFYDFLFSNILEDDLLDTYNGLIEKINLLNTIQKKYELKYDGFNRLIGECLYWAFSVVENEGINLSKLSNQLIDNMVVYLAENIDAFEMVRSSFSKELYNRYVVTSNFFNSELGIDFSIYLDYNSAFKELNNSISPVQDEPISFDELRINKPEPSSIAIMDICRQMEKQRFLIRPPYQRNEVINKKKSSSIIESILLGIKLPPIFVYKREDGISEVLDGQQRLLSILAFIEKPYLDENNKIRYSDKNGFALSLKNGILKNIHGKKFSQLSVQEKDKIKNFDLWIIEINHKNNKNFEPIDLFIRLNNKPYPIKEDTFEMWNSYISRDIIQTLKLTHQNNNNWFYLRKNNSRMEDENIYTALAYFQFNWLQSKVRNGYFPNEIDIYKAGDRINFRVKSKNEITKLLEDTENKTDFIEAINELEFDFIRKVKILLSNEDDSSVMVLNKNLDDIFIVRNGRRTQQAFYALWYFLFDIPLQKIIEERVSVRRALKDLFNCMTHVEDKINFEDNVKEFKSRFKNAQSSNHIVDVRICHQANLGALGQVIQGANLSALQGKVDLFSRSMIPYLKKAEFSQFKIIQEDLPLCELPDTSNIKDFFDTKQKILIRRNIISTDRFEIAYSDQRIAFASSFIGVTVNRFGFTLKYVCCVLASRLCFYQNFILHNVNYEDYRPITISDIKSILIPSIPLEEQRAFEIIFDFIYGNNVSAQSILFFERIMDALVYEISFKDQFEREGIEIQRLILDLKVPEVDSESQREQIITETYTQLSDPNHPMAANLLKMLSIGEVREVENYGDNR